MATSCECKAQLATVLERMYTTRFRAVQVRDICAGLGWTDVVSSIEDAIDHIDDCTEFLVQAVTTADAL